MLPIDPRHLLSQLDAEHLGWFGVGVSAAALVLVAYQVLLAPVFSAPESPPPRPTPPPVRVEVAGEVERPGSYDLPPAARVEDALRAAGGLTALADDSRLNLVARVSDGQRIVVPRQAYAPSARASGGPGAPAGPSPGTASLLPETPRPTLGPFPTRTPRPTLPPWPTPTARPTLAPWPTRTPRPTPRPWPTRTPRPTATPWPIRTPRPTATTWPTRTPTPSLEAFLALGGSDLTRDAAAQVAELPAAAETIVARTEAVARELATATAGGPPSEVGQAVPTLISRWKRGLGP